MEGNVTRNSVEKSKMYKQHVMLKIVSVRLIGIM